jgi:PAS domain S-box-containing protein
MKRARIAGTRKARARAIASQESPAEELRRANRALRATTAVNQGLIRATQESALLHQVCQVLIEAGGYRLAWVGYAEHDKGKTVRPVAQAGFEDGYLATLHLTWADAERGRGPTGTAIRTGELSIARNIETDPRFAHWRAEATRRGYHSSIALPLIIDGQTVGALSIYATEPDAFDDEEVKLLGELADDLAYGIAALRARQALHESQARYRLLVDFSPDPIGVHRNGILLYANPATARLLGVATPAELIGKSFADFVHPDHRKDLAQRFALPEGKQAPLVELQIVKPDGSLLNVETTASAITFEGKPAVQFLARDITARKRPEAALRHERDLIARIAETSPAGITVLNRDGQITFANARAEQVLGLTKDEITQRTYNAPAWRITDNDGNPFPDEDLPFRRVMSTGKPVSDVRHAITWQDGRRVLLSINAAPLLDASGQVDGVVATVEDVTERKKIEEVIKKEIDFAELATNAMPGIFFIFDENGKFLRWNRKLETVTGYSAEEIARQTPFDHLREDCKELVATRMREVFSNGRAELEVVFVSKAGKEVPYYCQGHRIVLDGTPYLIGTGMDISERKKMEEALRISEERYRVLAENANEAIVVAQEGMLKYANPKAVEITGYSKEELTSQSFTEFIHPDDRAMVVERHLARLRGGQVPEVYPFRVVSKEGVTKWAEISAVLITWDGRPATLNFLSDITERKRAEEALRESEQRYRSFVSHSSEGIYRIDMIPPVPITLPKDELVEAINQQAIVGEVNEALATMYGLKIEDMLGQHATDFAPNYGARAILVLQSENHRVDHEETRDVDRDGNDLFLMESYHGEVSNGLLQRIWGVQRDITERVRAQAELQISLEKYRVLLESFPLGISITDRSGKIIEANRESERLLDITRSEHLERTYDSKKWLIVRTNGTPMPADEFASVRALRENRLIENVEMGIVKDNGQITWISVTAAPIPLPEYGVAIAYGDITARKQTEESLRALSARQEALLAAVPDIIMEVDTNKVYTWANQTGHEFFGDDVIGKEASLYFEGEQDTYDTVQPLFNGAEDVIYVESWQRRKDGEKRLLAWWCRTLKDANGNVTGALSSARDITERKRAEEALRESESRFREIIEGSRDIIYRQGFSDGTLDYMSPSVVRVLGYTPEEMRSMGNDLAAQSRIFHPADLPSLLTFRDDLDKADASGAKFMEREFRMITSSGDTRWIHGVYRLTRDSAGHPNFILGTLQDITERKHAERALRESHDRLLTVLDSIEADIYVADLQTYEILFLNRHMRESFGDNLVGQVCWQVFRGSPQPCPHCTNARLVDADGNPTGLCVWEEQNPITQRWYTNYDRAIRWIDGRLVRVQIATDVTARKQAEEEFRRRANEFAALYDTARDLAAQQDLPTLLDTIAERARQLLGTSISEVCLYDPTRDDLELVVAKGYTPPDDRHLQMGEGMAGKVAQTRQPIIIDNYHTWSGRSLKYEDTPVSSSVQVPMLHRGELVGVIGLGDIAPQSHQFADADARLLSLFAAQAASAVHNARLLDETRRHLAELEAVSKISSALRSAQTLDEMLPRLLDETLAVLGTPAGVIWLHDAPSHALRQAVARGWFAQIRESPVQPGEGIAGGVFADGEAYRSREFASDPRARASTRPQIQPGWGGACVPIRTAQEIIGAFFVSVQIPRELTADEMHLLTTIAEIAGNAIHRTRLHEEMEKHIQRLAGLHTIDQAIAASLDLRLTLDVLLNQVVDQLRVHAAAILLLKLPTQTLEYAAGRGFRSNAMAHARLRIEDSSAGRVVRERRMISFSDLPNAAGAFTRAQLLASEQIVTYYGVPLIAKGQIKGVLEIFHRTPLQPDPEWLEYLETLAGQAAIAMDNAEMFETLQRSNVELMLAYDTTLEGWARALELRDYETEGHCQRVVELTIRLARALQFTDSELVHLRRGALLHDIGKLAIPDTILLKPDPLTEAEWEIMRQHPIHAHDLLSPIVFLRPALDIPSCHHEKWDGSGYPRGLKGEGIPLAARLFAIVDVWDAMRSARPYRQALTDAEVQEYIRAQAAKHFDPQVVELFLRLIESK